MIDSDAELPPRLGSLTFHGPLSEDRAERLVRRIAASGPADVLDIGCGWGELLLRVLDAVPGAKGTGIDINAEDLARGRALAAERGLADRAVFVEESARGTARGPVDAVLCLGSSQALCDPELPYDPAEVLRELRRLVRPGGVVVLGEGFWERTPTEAELAGMWPGARVDDHLPLGDLVDLALGAGFRPAWIESAGREEWEVFESGYRYDTELWLAAHPDHPLAAETRERVDRQRSGWLNGYRNVLGIAYLTLVATA
ncbi:SAM-dependent methyltransferase [Streptomyces filamentosus]|uniref:SAM-dependent methyltransferase n=1 Tax=Streptomyces filamentosus TaxID=67294 RepID=A0A919BSF3_STRFL|nr:class I SAM-dependent methyltransferase [Streptomyces filamentosus]GHG10942.1 SAM-dependent methyltransferase [Streptomyces filamentosus]